MYGRWQTPSPKMRLPSHPCGHFEAIAPGHLQVEQQKVGEGKLVTPGIFPTAFEISDDFVTVGDFMDQRREVGLLKRTAQHENIVLAVLSQEDHWGQRSHK